MKVRAGPENARSYQCSSRTSREAHEVLDELATRNIPGVQVSERGRSYLVLEPPQRRLYGMQTAAFMAAAIVIISLMFTAVSPVFSLLLFAAVLPMIPLVVIHRPSLAVSALSDDDGTTRINVHGEASPELAAALDAFVGSLPPAGSKPAPPATSSGTPRTDPGPSPPEGSPARPRGLGQPTSRPGSEPPPRTRGSSPTPAAAVDHMDAPAMGPGTTAPPRPKAAMSGGTAVVLFNPACSRCRETCRILDVRGVPIALVRYLEDVPKPGDLLRVMRLLGTDDPRTMVRADEPIYAELELATASHDRLIAAMVEHPILIQRPIVIMGDRAIIARPSELVLTLLESVPADAKRLSP